MAWAWDSQSAARSWKLTEDGYGRRRTFRRALLFTSRSQLFGNNLRRNGKSRPRSVNPEEAFVVLLSICHMLTVFAIACRERSRLGLAPSRTVVAFVIPPRRQGCQSPLFPQ